MRFIGLISLIAFLLALASCGSHGGRGYSVSDYPVMYGTYAYTFNVTGDPNSVVGVLVEDEILNHLSTTNQGAAINAYDSYGRVYSGTFSTTAGAFTLNTDDAWQQQVTVITITGNFDDDQQKGSGTFTMTFTEGFGDHDGAVVTGTWTSNRI